jgi:AcrR family transcriptional regulator
MSAVGAEQRAGVPADPETARPPRYPAKRAAIARAALELFVREGYERASVDAIAAEAGVSKRTVYNHFADKEQLFLAVVGELYAQLMGQAEDIAERALAEDQMGPRLLTFVGQVAHGIHRSPGRAAIMRLILTEAPHIPALLDQWRDRRMLTPLLAGLLTGAAADRELDLADPDVAASHLSALTFGQINGHSLFGLLVLTDEQLDTIITGGVDVFLRAYRR